MPPELIPVANQMQQHWNDLDKERVAQKKRMTQLMEPSWSFDERLIVFLEPSVVDVQNQIRNLKLQVTGLISAASIFLAKNPAAPSSLTYWTAALQGGVVAEPKFMLSKGTQGVGFGYSRAVNVKRKIYISDNFRSQHVQAAQAIETAMSRPGTQWSNLSSWQNFAAESQKAQAQKRLKTVVALASQATAEALAQGNVMTCQQFFEFISKCSCLRRGVCGI